MEITVSYKKIYGSVAVAALIWFYMFSPWTAGLTNFWLTMTCAAVVLTTLTLCLTPDRMVLLKVERPLMQLAVGVAIAFALWGIFWLGDKISAWMFSFARPEVDSVYSMKEGFPAWLIAVLLLTVIGPAEELFWRGFIQHSLQSKMNATLAFIITTAIYGLVHIWSLNFMLVMAALVAGGVWGLIYRIKPSLLHALIVSHALWDALVFIIMPI